MYNRQLDVFLKVAELGSFSRAARALFVTPSAVIQQINTLESHFQTLLFVRTKRGVALTEAGRYLQAESQALIERNEQVLRTLRRLSGDEQQTVRLGTDILHKCRIFSEIWSDYSAVQPCQLVMTRLELGWKQYDHTDLLESVCDGEIWQKDWRFLPVCHTPLMLMCSRTHPLSGRTVLTESDLKGKTVVTICSGMSRTLDDFATAMTNIGAKVRYVSAYNYSTFNICDMQGELLQIPACWRDLYPNMVALSVPGGFALEYGLWLHPDACAAAARFWAFAGEQLENESYRARLMKRL